MYKIYLIVLVIICCTSCAKDESTATGNIYGIVTVKETAEPMRATGVELYHYGSLLLRTVTYDDGHYEFEDLSAGTYELKVVASGYVDTSYSVIVESGRTARADMQLERLNTYLVVRTLAATEVNEDEATLNGSYSYQYNGYSPSEVGFIYSTTPSPSNDGTTITSSVNRSFSSKISNLKKGKYYFQAYAKNKVGTEYGEIQTFEIKGLPIVITLNVSNVTANTATLNGRIDYAGDPVYTERGFVYSSTFPNPTINDPDSKSIKIQISGTSEEFSANVTELTTGITYYVRAYAINSTGVGYGDVIEFQHEDCFILENDGLIIQKNDISAGADWETAYNLCKSSNINGRSDWRLPTRGECITLYEQKSSLNIKSDLYWTSDYYSYYRDYYYYNFSSGSVSHASPSSSMRVRCVCTLK